MENKLDLSKVISSLKKGDIAELRKLQSKVDNSGNANIEIDWQIEYDAGNKQLMSIFNIKPKTSGSIIKCVLAGMSKNNYVLCSGLASQLSKLSTQEDGSYTGWTWCNYTPTEKGTINGEVTGTIQLPDGSSTTFDFHKSIII